jgi:hypothetical protein
VCIFLVEKKKERKLENWKMRRKVDGRHAQSDVNTANTRDFRSPTSLFPSYYDAAHSRVRPLEAFPDHLAFNNEFTRSRNSFSAVFIDSRT